MTDFSEELKKRMEVVNSSLNEYLSIGDNETLKKAMNHYPLAGGKRFRPILAMLMGDAVSGSGKRTIPFGCALELIHNFTLVHDDIMDNDDKRRGIQTVHKAFDMPTAIIAGDALFSLSFEVISKSDVDDKILRILIHDTAATVRNIAEGQQMDMEFENRMDVSENEYLEMIGKKTAVLFGLATKGGAMVAGGSEVQVDKAYDYGYFLGMGFQIKDDLLGILGDEKVLGKPVGSDIRNGKKTVIALNALKTMDDDQKGRFLNVFGHENAGDEKVLEAIELLKACGAIEYAQDKARDYSSRIKKSLEVLDESIHKKNLEEFADFVISRSA
jgi:geranylgeranyl diphosphate synthase type I